MLNSIYTSEVAPAASQADPQLTLLELSFSISILSVWAVYLLSGALTIVLTVSKPLRRSDIIFGKWLGYALILCTYTAMLFFTFLGIIFLQTGYWPQQAIPALGMLELSTLVLLALTTLGSACFPTLVSGATAIMLFIGAPLASFIQLITSHPGQTAQNITTTINLVIPTDALWHGASFYLIPSFVSQLGQGRLQELNTPFTSIQPIAPGILIWAVLYCIVLPVIGALRFQHRDL